jgi:hypothetical protein
LHQACITYGQEPPRGRTAAEWLKEYLRERQVDCVGRTRDRYAFTPMVASDHFKKLSPRYGPIDPETREHVTADGVGSRTLSEGRPEAFEVSMEVVERTDSRGS